MLRSLPTEGGLMLNGEAFTIGRTFTQADINDALLVYTNTNPDATQDQFDFDVLSANGQWIPNEVFMIVFGENMLSASAIATQYNDCADDMDGAITVNVSGLDELLQYSLKNGPVQPANTFTGLSAGTYTVEVLTEDGSLSVTTNTVVIVSPEAIASVVSVAENTISVAAEGGVGDLLYSINGGDFQESTIFADLENGSYTITVMDESGCTFTDPVVVVINLIVSVATSCY